MAGQIFAYIRYKDGVPDDSALELAAAAKKTGSGLMRSANPPQRSLTLHRKMRN